MTVGITLKRIEKRLCIERDDKIAEFPLGDDEIIKLTRRAFR